MNGKQTALMPGNSERIGYWRTPPELMDVLEEEFHFDYDPCPFPRPAGFNGLEEPWGKSNWVNPPLRKGLSGVPWARKAIAESKDGKLSVIVAPSYYWVALLLEAGAEARYLPPTRWIAPNGTRKASHRLNTLLVLRPHP